MKYSFECKDCGLVFDVESNLSEISGLTPVCPGCQSLNVKRKYEITFILKGNGFYKTDNENRNEGK